MQGKELTGFSVNQTASRKRGDNVLITQRYHGDSYSNRDYLENTVDTMKPVEKTSRSESAAIKEVICRACGQPILGLIVQAMGETWHQDHFLCTECNKPISSNRFNVEHGKPYCEEDYANLFLKKCFGCKAPIRDVVVVALNQNWHRDHFVCITCGSKLASKGFFERDNNPFCQQCYEEKFCPKCSECSIPITDTAVMALGEKWHQHCFTCKKCQTPVMDSTFEVIDNRPICSNCISK